MTTTLGYDPSSRLLSIAKSGYGTTKFLYDGSDLIAEYDGSGTLLKRYVHGPGDDEPLVSYDYTAGGAKTYLHADDNGSVVLKTDTSGAQVGTINTYDEYGLPAAGNSGRFQYTGQTWLPEIGMYYYKARLYNPAIGRFLQTDPIGYGDGMNWYNYVHGDPVNGSDPDGTCTSPDTSSTCVEVHGCDRKCQQAGSEASNNYFWNSAAYWSHWVLGAASFCPSVCGSAFSTIDGGIYAAQGKYVDAGLSFAAAGVGLISDAGAVKLAGKGGVLAFDAIKGGKTLVYHSVENGVTKYVGITDKIAQRAATHLREKSIVVDAIPGLGNLSRADARAVEQVLIEEHGLASQGGTLMNKINSIATTNPKYAGALERGAELLKKAGYPGF